MSDYGWEDFNREASEQAREHDRDWLDHLEARDLRDRDLRAERAGLGESRREPKNLGRAA